MAHTAQHHVSKQPEYRPGMNHMASEPILFNELWLGDRFKIINKPELADVVFTKTKHDQARRHSHESIELGEKGYGYLDDSIVAVTQNTIVVFLPIE